ncbi:Adenosylmethionine-8-amino-7-oxononanoate aminotransferase [Vulgatibacter incomptus]|uniref:adenosylmethionine--8-amino-7-oxononanoate transaminase n=1 Tax=Vulgatibacter incomptus TaxID=1391653 RepID=A0A0K1PHK4_9BACT|nr:Adenosylmethionine-8-amino-7-oxononanoate aminotransferase [Vulgatibacter incomptus]
MGARGSRLLLDGGSELVDGLASWWTAAHGYAHPHIADRVQEQLHKLPHVAFGGLAHEAGYTLAKRLCSMLPAPLGHAFLVESGSVAVEVALKIALQSFHNRGETRRRKVVCFEGAYHGDTFATMALCDPVDGMHRAFSGTGIDAVHLPLPGEDDAFERAFAAIAPEVACAIVEPLAQCAGGIRLHDPAVLRRLRRACDEHGVLLVFDEIATGFYRTGAPFALLEADVVPDLLTVGKALTGGTLPLAATIASEALFESFLSDDAGAALQHGPTYMANALSCAAAHASLDLFEASDYGARVAALESKLHEGFRGLEDRPFVRDVRVKGAIAAVELEPGRAPTSTAFAEHGAFVRPLRLHGSDVVYLMPPLTIDDADLEVLFQAVSRCLPR